MPIKKSITLVSENVYRHPCWFVFGYKWDDKFFQQVRRKDLKLTEAEEKQIAPHPGVSGKWVVNDRTAVSLIWINPESKAPLPVLIHEITHLCVQILCAVGIPINQDTDEALTYLVEYFSNEAFKLMGLKDTTR